MQTILKQKAVTLRHQGLSYSEILKEVPVAKSTLALWLQSVGLSQKQKQRLTQKKLEAAHRGAAKKRQIRIEKTDAIKNAAKLQAAKLFHNPLWLIGTVLYWGEGEKEKSWRPSSRVTFSNMDAQAHKMFLRWTDTFLRVPQDLFVYAIFIHKGAATKEARKFWSEQLHVPEKRFVVYFKNKKSETQRKNTGENYHGVLMIRIRKSSDLNRKIAGWIEYVIESCA